jgi:hypothetical protein
MLLGNNELSASEVKVNNGSLYAKSTVTNTGLLNNLETAVNLTTPALLCSLNR